jgi:hypothetical protein
MAATVCPCKIVYELVVETAGVEAADLQKLQTISIGSLLNRLFVRCHALNRAVGKWDRYKVTANLSTSFIYLQGQFILNTF